MRQSNENNNDPVQLDLRLNDLSNLPRGIRVAIAKGLSRLRRIRIAISEDAGLPMPAIRVQPAGWASEEAMQFARAHPIQFDDGHREWGVEFPASTLVYIKSDDTLRRILCHEYAHCFWFICEILRAMTLGRSELIMKTNPGISFERQEQDDSEKLANPADWFGKSDVEHFMSDYGQPDLVAATEQFAEWWVGQNLPISLPDSKFMVQEIHVPAELYDRARKLIV